MARSGWMTHCARPGSRTSTLTTRRPATTSPPRPPDSDLSADAIAWPRELAQHGAARDAIDLEVTVDPESWKQTLAAACERWQVPGASLAVRLHDRDIVAHFGRRSIAHGGAVGDRTRFPMLSVAKVVTAALAAEAVADGLLAWDASVCEVVPELGSTPGYAGVTLRHLAAMTGAVPFGMPQGGDGEDAVARVASWLADKPPVAPPGIIWSYSNLGFVLVGRALEVALDDVWERLVDRFAVGIGLRPGCWQPQEDESDAVTEHALRGEQLTEVPSFRPRGFAPAGSWLMTTAADLLRFARWWLENGDRVAALQRETVRVPLPELAGGWCLGTARYAWGRVDAFGWEGMGAGSRSYWRVIPQHDAAMVLLTNAAHGRHVLRELEPLVRDQLGCAPAPRTVGGTSPPPLRDLVGTYTWPGLPPAVVTHENGRLTVTDIKGIRRLTPLDQLVFRAEPADEDLATIAFARSEPTGPIDLYYPGAMAWRRS